MAERRRSMDESILEYIDAYVRRVGCGPSYREIGTAVGLSSTSSVSRHVLSLKRAGLLETDAYNRLRLVRGGLREDEPERVPPRITSKDCHTQRLKLLLEDGGEMHVDCYIDRSGERPELRLSGVMESGVNGSRVTRVVGCHVERGSSAEDPT